MAKVSTSKDCFYGGNLYRKGDTLEYTGVKKDMPKYFTEIEAAKSEDEKLTAADIVKLINSAESLSDIEEFADDDRKTVKEAFEQKFAELTAE